MQVSYRREMNYNYMILAAENEAPGYECRMLASNSIEGLLKFRLRRTEDRAEYYYEITSRQPLNRLLELRKIKGEEIRSLLLSFAALSERMEEYLLPQESLLFDPEFIYISPDSFEAAFCFVPGHQEEVPAALSGLLKYLLERADHEDRDGVVLAYRLYQQSLRENYGIEELLNCLSGTKADPEAAPQDDSQTAKEEPGEQEELWEAETDRAPVCREESGNGRITQRKKGPAAAVLLLLLAAEFLIWFLMGTGGLLRYGPAAAGMAAALLLFGGRAGSRFSNGTQKEESEEGEENFELPRISEEDRQRQREGEEKEQMKREQEEGTVLLSVSRPAESRAVLEPEEPGREPIEIEYVPFIIGKSRDLADYCLCENTVSRLHLRIERDGETYTATDLNSTNGTSLNGEELQVGETRTLESGDRICLADQSYRFCVRKQ